MGYEYVAKYTWYLFKTLFLLLQFHKQGDKLGQVKGNKDRTRYTGTCYA